MKKLSFKIEVKGNKTHKKIDTILDTYNGFYPEVNGEEIMMSREELKKYPLFYYGTFNEDDEDIERLEKLAEQGQLNPEDFDELEKMKRMEGEVKLLSDDFDNILQEETEGMNQQQTKQKIKELVEELQKEIRGIEAEAEKININETFEVEL